MGIIDKCGVGGDARFALLYFVFDILYRTYATREINGTTLIVTSWKPVVSWRQNLFFVKSSNIENFSPALTSLLKSFRSAGLNFWFINSF